MLSVIIAKNKDKQRQIGALRIALKSDLPEKDRTIFTETLRILEAELNK